MSILSNFLNKKIKDGDGQLTTCSKCGISILPYDEHHICDTKNNDKEKTATLEERLKFLEIDEIKYRSSKWLLMGCYTSYFSGDTILEALENAEKILGRKL